MGQLSVSCILSLSIAGTALLLLTPPVAAGGSLLPGAPSDFVPGARVAVGVAAVVLRARVPLVLQGTLRVVLLVAASMLLLRVAGISCSL